MERSEWLQRMRRQAEALYDHLAPAYWVTFGLYGNESHQQFIHKFLGRLSPQSSLLDAACGAGRYDGMLLEPGHSVLGIDQSGSMLARAREVWPRDRFPKLTYTKVALQEMDFQAQFDGAICMDALEHVCPEDWPGVALRLQRAVKPRGWLYVTVELAEPDKVHEAYERGKARGLPLLPGEVVDEVDAAFAEVSSVEWKAIPRERAAVAVYHYYPGAEQVRTWMSEAGMAIVEEGTGDGYWHLLAQKTTEIPSAAPRGKA